MPRSRGTVVGERAGDLHVEAPGGERGQRVAADERPPAPPGLAVLDRLEQEAGAVADQPVVGGDGGGQVGEQLAPHGDDRVGARQRAEVVEAGPDHRRRRSGRGVGPQACRPRRRTGRSTSGCRCGRHRRPAGRRGTAACRRRSRRTPRGRTAPRPTCRPCATPPAGCGSRTPCDPRPGSGAASRRSSTPSSAPRAWWRPARWRGPGRRRCRSTRASSSSVATIGGGGLGGRIGRRGRGRHPAIVRRLPPWPAIRLWPGGAVRGRPAGPSAGNVTPPCSPPPSSATWPTWRPPRHAPATAAGSPPASRPRCSTSPARASRPSGWAPRSTSPLRTMPPAGTLPSWPARPAPDARRPAHGVVRHLAALDALQPTAQLLRLGWVDRGRHRHGGGKDRPVCFPLVSQPTRVAGQGLPAGPLVPHGPPELTPLVPRPRHRGPARGRTPSTAAGRSSRSSGGNRTAALIARLPRLQSWIREVVDAGGPPARCERCCRRARTRSTTAAARDSWPSSARSST